MAGESCEAMQAEMNMLKRIVAESAVHEKSWSPYSGQRGIDPNRARQLDGVHNQQQTQGNASVKARMDYLRQAMAAQGCGDGMPEQQLLQQTQGNASVKTQMDYEAMRAELAALESAGPAVQQQNPWDATLRGAQGPARQHNSQVWLEQQERQKASVESRKRYLRQMLASAPALGSIPGMIGQPGAAYPQSPAG